MALPFGSFEAALDAAPDADALRRLITAADSDPSAANLAAVRDAVQRMELPQQLVEQLEGVLASQNLTVGGRSMEGTLAALRRVWASKWNDRAVLSMRKAGQPHGAVQMAVLVQQLLPAKYAFVSHTCNPVSGAPSNAPVRFLSAYAMRLLPPPEPP